MTVLTQLKVKLFVKLWGKLWVQAFRWGIAEYHSTSNDKGKIYIHENLLSKQFKVKIIYGLLVRFKHIKS